MEEENEEEEEEEEGDDREGKISNFHIIIIFLCFILFFFPLFYLCRHYADIIESKFMRLPQITPELVHEIACAKSEVVGFCIDATEELKKTVGTRRTTR